MADKWDIVQLKDTIDNMVDDRGLFRVVQILRQVCSDNAEYWRDDYEDEELAQDWEAAESLLSQVSESLPGTV